MSIFAKKLGRSPAAKPPVDPVELYQTLFQQEGFGYLRGVQEEILREWHEKREVRDIVGKMNTGSGKTLVGLLMLYSKIVEGMGPGLYCCPDNQLVAQTKRQADVYGIPACVFSSGGDIPADFVNGRKILICTFEKVFNGLSIFGVGSGSYVKVGCAVIDDAHRCVEKARSQSTVRVDSKHPLWNRLLTLFSDALRSQQPGTFEGVRSGDPLKQMRVPYWAWFDNLSTVTSILAEYRTDDAVKFAWGLIGDDLATCDCFLSGRSIEISPIHVPYHQIPSLNEAKHRFVLSATYNDDASLLRDLGISKDSILNPLVPRDRKDIGQRLILVPTRYDARLGDEFMRAKIVEFGRKVNTVVLVPSDALARPWVDLGAVQASRDSIDVVLEKLRKNAGNLVVLSNRYDGVDLPNKTCRILVIDGRPSYVSLRDQYLASVRSGSPLVDARLGQVIEQGLGRAVRSGSDYCVVFILGADLVRFLLYEQNLQYFATVTQTQLRMGLELLDEEASNDPLQTIMEAARSCLQQDSRWRQYHQSEMMKVAPAPISDLVLGQLSAAACEQQALLNYRRRRYFDAAREITSLIEDKPKWFTERDKAWYFQMAAQMIYPGDKGLANDYQTKAMMELGSPRGVFQPQLGPVYTKIGRPGPQAGSVRALLAGYTRIPDISIDVEDMLRCLQFNPDIPSDDFEESLMRVGRFIGFSAQMPERELDNGPDVLWCMTDSHHVLLEAKSGRMNSKISRRSIEQLLGSEQWFIRQYGSGAKYTPVSVQPSGTKEKNANPSDRMRVMDQDCLDRLRDSLRGFTRSLQSKQPNSWTESEIARLLADWSLTPDRFLPHFTKPLR